jgi:hypothetical protein
MSSISRTYARASKRSGNLMKQFQPPGAYAKAEKGYNEALAKKRAIRAGRRD